MRQTSRAVALLLTLESAQAASVALVAPTLTQDFANPQFNSAIDVGAQNQSYSRMSPYNPAANLPGSNTWGNPVPMSSSMVNSSSTKLDNVVAGSQCMKCVGGGGVWCSRTYAYTSSSTLQGSTTVTQSGTGNLIGMKLYPNGLSAITGGTNLTEALMVAGAGADNGSCCAASTSNMIVQIGKVGTAAVTTTITNDMTSTILYVGQVCLAYKDATVTPKSGATNNAKAVGVGFVATGGTALTTQFSSWWCSNGLYQRTTASGDNTYNTVQPLFASQNQRTELAFAACPQILGQCGGAGKQINTATAIAASASNNIVITLTSATNGGPTNQDKCTWVFSCTQCAPTFTMEKNGSAGLGIATPNWQIHSMEYVGTTLAQGGLVLDNGSAGYSLATAGLSKTNFLPRFDMPQASYSLLRTWYGKGAVAATVGGNWQSPYQNLSSGTTAALQVTQSTNTAGVAGQWMGDVANMPDSTFGSTAGGTGTYGVVSSVAYDVRVVRYFPAQVAVASWTAGNTLYGAAGSYATAVTAYTTAKTNWDAYVALLAKNAKADAFAAAFSPPKAPTVPPLPSQPWVPGSYQGYIKQTPAEKELMMKDATLTSSAKQPTSQQFWMSQGAASGSGGWGIFTAQIMQYRNGWGKSFGTIGYSGDTNKTAKSIVWNYSWTCSTTATTGTAGSLCDKLYSTTATNASTAVATSNAANTTPLYVAVSLWSLGNTEVTTDAAAGFATTKNDLVLTFIPAAWDQSIVGYTAFTAPAPTTAASSLTGIAGAQALAASAAAALAAAAALY